MPRTAKKPTNGKAPNAGQSAAPVTPARVQPVTTPTGLPYGEAKSLADAQKQLPIPGAVGPGLPAGGGVPAVGPGAGGAGGSGGPGGSGGGMDAAIAAAQQFAHTPGGLGAPTTRPNEPITAGLPSGPGAGPEALNPAPAVPSALAQGAAILNALGSRISPEARQLRDLVNATIGNQAAQ